MEPARRRRDEARAGEPPPAPPPLPVGVPDTHCHLDLVGGDVAAAVAAARAVRVAPLLTVGVDVGSSRWCARTAVTQDGVYAAVAIHPNESGAAGEDDWAQIERLAGEPKVVAVGETGLDHFRTGEDGWAAQEESFRRHVDIAKRTGRALVIHDREAHADVLRVLAAEGAPARTVFHCFSGDTGLARACADAGYYLSFAGNVTFSSAGGLREALTVAPAELLLVETDAPFLTPVPHRGRPNGSYLVPLTVAAMAAARGKDVGELGARLAANAAAAFGWPFPAPA